MKLVFDIEYRTRWGEQLVLLLGKRKIAMRYTDGGIWRTNVEIRSEAETFEYRYAVERDNAQPRTEWYPHTLRLAEFSDCRVLRIHDRWLDIDSDTPFRTVAYTRGIFARRSSSPVTKRHKGDKAAPQAVFRMIVPALWPDETLAIASDRLDNWQRIVPFNDTRFPEWELFLALPKGSEYKFLIADRTTLTPILWEEGANRIWAGMPPEGERLIEASLQPRIPERHWRSAGTALPVFSLRSEQSFGVGEFLDLKLLVDWAVATQQRVIQLLPINDTTMTHTWEDSYPYNANSTFALHPQFIRLTEAGVEEDDAYRSLRNELNALPEVDYERVNSTKLRLLREAFARHGARTADRRDYRDFLEVNREWLLPYAAFCSLRDEYGTADFSRWGDYAHFERAKVEAYCRKRRREVAFHCYVQYHLHLQLTEVVRYAHVHGVILKGDLPIGISRTSADAWQFPRLFHMDSQAGAPPDAFSAAGQNWGFPTYDWERMSRDNFSWWKARLRKMSEYFDAYRIDHILGFFRIWEIPVEAVHGLLGHFNPAMPYPAEELRGMGFDLAEGRYTTPPTDGWILERLFGELAGEVRSKYLRNGHLQPACATQRRVLQLFPGDDERSKRLRDGFLALLDDVLFVEDPYRKGHYHPASQPNRPSLSSCSPPTAGGLQPPARRLLLPPPRPVLAGIGFGQAPDAAPCHRHARLRRGPRYDPRLRSRDDAGAEDPLARDPAHAQVALRDVRRSGTLPLPERLHHLDPRHESAASLVGRGPQCHEPFLPRGAARRGRHAVVLRTVDLPPHHRHAPLVAGNVHHPAPAGLALDGRRTASADARSGADQRSGHPALLLALPHAPDSGTAARRGGLQHHDARHDRYEPASLSPGSADRTNNTLNSDDTRSSRHALPCNTTVLRPRFGGRCIG